MTVNRVAYRAAADLVGKFSIAVSRGMWTAGVRSLVFVERIEVQEDKIMLHVWERSLEYQDQTWLNTVIFYHTYAFYPWTVGNG